MPEDQSSHPTQVEQNSSERRRQFFKSFEAKSLRSRSFLTQIADDLTEIFGSTAFLFLNAVFFAAWILINTGYTPGIKPFDPYPFGLLTMAVSLEAIFLSIFVLVSQNRSSYISSIREEVHLRVNLIAEEEITKILAILAEMKKEMGIKKPDKELDEMLNRIDTGYIEQTILKQIERAKPSLAKKLAEEFPYISAPFKKTGEVISNIASNGSDTTPVTKKSSSL